MLNKTVRFKVITFIHYYNICSILISNSRINVKRKGFSVFFVFLSATDYIFAIIMIQLRQNKEAISLSA